MAAGNAVTLTFAGDASSAVKAFDNVGAAADGMSRKVDDAASGFDRAGEAADTVDTRAMGLRDTLTGVQDSLSGVSMLAKGPSFEGFLTLGAGIGDLGSGFYNALIPGIKSSVEWLKAGKLATVGQTIASKAAAVGNQIWAGAQWLLNAAFWASPITWIVVGIIALVAVIVLIATKTDWFQRLWGWAWGGIKAGAEAVWSWISGTLWPGIKGVFDRLGNVFSSIPGRLRDGFSGLVDIITWPFRTAFNFVSDAWNNTIGRLSWTVPGWVPFVGGNSISAPKLPHFHTGGIVSGAFGAEALAVLQAGERVTPAGGGGNALTLVIQSGGTRQDDLILEALSRAVDRRGGDVRRVVGSNRG